MSLVNTKGQDGAEVLVRWQAGGPGFADLARMIADHEAPFEVIAVESGLELACHNRPDDVQNRARLRIHDYGDDKMAAFFFKRSERLIVGPRARPAVTTVMSLPAVAS